MTYTISTEPVTREHIGRRVLAVERAYFDLETAEEVTLISLHGDLEEGYISYQVEGGIRDYYDAVLLIVEN